MAPPNFILLTKLMRNSCIQNIYKNIKEEWAYKLNIVTLH